MEIEGNINSLEQFYQLFEDDPSSKWYRDSALRYLGLGLEFFGPKVDFSNIAALYELTPVHTRALVDNYVPGIESISGVIAELVVQQYLNSYYPYIFHDEFLIHAREGVFVDKINYNYTGAVELNEGGHNGEIDNLAFYSTPQGYVTLVTEVKTGSPYTKRKSSIRRGLVKAMAEGFDYKLSFLNQNYHPVVACLVATTLDIISYRLHSEEAYFMNDGGVLALLPFNNEQLYEFANNLGYAKYGQYPPIQNQMS